ncbi:MAG: hypothetical protein AB1489_20175 [Acidobacteriota bacterium]
MSKQLNCEQSIVDLLSRLIQRQDSATGLINIDHPRNIYMRTMGWVLHRLKLLGELKDQYAAEGSCENTSPLLNRSSRQERVSPSTNIALPPQIAYLLTPPLGTDLPEKFRISRRPSDINKSDHDKEKERIITNNSKVTKEKSTSNIIHSTKNDQEVIKQQVNYKLTRQAQRGKIVENNPTIARIETDNNLSKLTLPTLTQQINKKEASTVIISTHISEPLIRLLSKQVSDSPFLQEAQIDQDRVIEVNDATTNSNTVPMVWRKNGNGYNGQTINRVEQSKQQEILSNNVTTLTNVLQNQNHQIEKTVTPVESIVTGQIDLEQITRQVVRVISRKLEIESERRGISR